MDLRNLPKFIFSLILVFYPFFSFLVYEGTGVNPDYLFGFICLSILLIKLYAIYSAGENLVVPSYIAIFGVFTAYIILSSIFVSDLFIEKGAVKYFYSNSFIMTFVGFLIIENTCFPKKWIKLAIKILGVVLIISAIVSVIQIFEPLFFIKNRSVIEGFSYDRIAEYYDNNPEEETSSMSRLLDGYRSSIYSYISGLSVGIDTMAIFSLLIALKTKKWVKTALWVIAAALVSFLSSSRWIMVNFLIIGSQNIWISKNKILNTVKYGLYGLTLLVFLVPLLEFSGLDIQRFTEERLTDNSASTRILAFEVFSKVFPDHPVVGTGGVDTQEVQRLLGGRSSQIHVGYLKLFYYYGLIGGLLYLAFLFALLKRMWHMSRSSNYWGGFFAILAFAIANLTLVEFSLFYHGLLLALIFSNHFYDERTKNFSFFSNQKKNRLITGTENQLQGVN